MSIEIWEVEGSRTGEEDTRNPGRQIHYRIRGTQDESAVYNKVYLTKPLTVGSYVYNGFSVESLGYDLWSAVVQYVHPSYTQPDKGQSEPPPVGTARFQFTTKGQTEHIDRALDETALVLTHTAVDMDYAINFDGQTVHGLDRVVPKLGLVVDYTIPGAVLTPAYIGKAHYLTGRTNASTWHGFEAEEVLFMGIDAGFEYGKDTTLAFEFAIELQDDNYYPEVLNPDPPGNTPQTKKGWWYGWVLSDFSVDNNKPVSNIRQVQLSQIYPTGDFDLLALPLPATLIERYSP